MGPACMSEAAAATFHQECFGWRAASRAWKSAECTSTFWPRSACSPSPRGRMPVMIREKRRWSGRWCRVIWLMSVISYRIASEITGCGLEEERERERNAKKKRTRRGKNEYTFGPRAKYIRSCRKRMNYPCMARMKKRRGKKIGVKTQKRKKIALYSALGKNVYITRKNIYFKMFQKKRCKKKTEETWSFAYGRPPESLASAEDNWITPLWSLYISA